MSGTGTAPGGAGGKDLRMMTKIRAALKESSRGRGLAGSFVEVFSRSPSSSSSSGRAKEIEMVRRILLGTPTEIALTGLISEGSVAGELLRFIGALARVDSSEASRGAERLSSMFEKWTLLREKRAMERKVMGFRGLIVSTVAGVVVGMLATLGPVISNFQISLGTPMPTSSSGISIWEGAALLFPSALALGFFLSPARPYLNAAASLAAFFLVVYFLGPLASFSLGP